MMYKNNQVYYCDISVIYMTVEFQMFLHPQCSTILEGHTGPHKILLQHSSLDVHRLPVLHRRMRRAVELRKQLSKRVD